MYDIMQLGKVAMIRMMRTRMTWMMVPLMEMQQLQNDGGHQRYATQLPSICGLTINMCYNKENKYNYKNQMIMYDIQLQ